MELSYNALKKLQVISLTDGKNLGRVCDAVIIYPENSVKGFCVTGGRSWFARAEEFVPWNRIVKIGEDVILIKRDGKGERPDCKPQPPCPPRGGCRPRRDTEDYE